MQIVTMNMRRLLKFAQDLIGRRNQMTQKGGPSDKGNLKLKYKTYNVCLQYDFYSWKNPKELND